MTKQPVSGKALRQAREEGYIIELAQSGNVVRLRPVPLDALLLAGKVPDYLTNIVADLLWGQLGQESKTDATEDTKQFTELVNLITTAALLEPRVVINPQADDEISIDDLSFSDRVAIYTYARQPAEVLKYFRDKQASAMEPVSDSQGDPQPTEQADAGEAGNPAVLAGDNAV